MAAKKQEMNVDTDVRAAEPVMGPPVLTVKIDGPGVRKGRIAVPDLLRICADTQNAVMRQAEAMEGRRTIHRGPAAREIQQECTLELTAVEEGSTCLAFALANPQMPLPIPGHKRFGVEVIEALTDTIQGLGSGSALDEIDPGVLQSIYDLTEPLGKRGISTLEWELAQDDRPVPKRVAINQAVREKAAVRIAGKVTRMVTVDGVLDMADFSRRDRKCRIDPAAGPSVVCSFAEVQEKAVQSFLRQAVRVTGKGVFHPHTGRLESLEMEGIFPMPTFAPEENSFFRGTSIRELAAQQGVRALTSIADLRLPDFEDNVEAFLAAIHEGREPA